MFTKLLLNISVVQGYKLQGFVRSENGIIFLSLPVLWCFMAEYTNVESTYKTEIYVEFRGNGCPENLCQLFSKSSTTIT